MKTRSILIGLSSILGLSLCSGLFSAAYCSEAKEMNAATSTAVYTVASATSVKKSGVAPEGSSATFKNTYTSNKEQMTGGDSMTLTLSGYQGSVVTGIKLSMHSNNSKGAGKLSVVAGSTSIASISSATNFNKWYDNSQYTQTFKDISVALTNSEYVIKDNEDLVITISATTNSLYCQSFTIQYEEGNTSDPALKVSSKSITMNSNSADTSLVVTPENFELDHLEVEIDEDSKTNGLLTANFDSATNGLNINSGVATKDLNSGTITLKGYDKVDSVTPIATTSVNVSVNVPEIKTSPDAKTSVKVGETRSISLDGIEGYDLNDGDEIVYSAKDTGEAELFTCKINPKSIVLNPVGGTGKYGSTSVMITASVNEKVIATKEISVTVTKDVESIEIKKPESTTIYTGDTLQLEAIIGDGSDKTISWTSSNKNVASVTSNGLVNGIANGKTTITLTASNGTADTADDISDSIEIEVKAKPFAVENYSKWSKFQFSSSYPEHWEGTASSYFSNGMGIKSASTYIQTKSGESFENDVYNLNVRFVGISNGATATSLSIIPISEGEELVDLAKDIVTPNGTNFTYDSGLSLAEKGSSIVTLCSEKRIDGLKIKPKSFSKSVLVYYVELSYITDEQINEEADLFGGLLLDSTSVCDPNGSTNLIKDNDWSDLKEIYNEYLPIIKEKIISTSGNVEGSNIEQAIARYTYIVNKYNDMEDFLGLRKESNNSNILVPSSGNNTTLIVTAIIVASGITGLALLGFARKRKEP